MKSVDRMEAQIAAVKVQRIARGHQARRAVKTSVAKLAEASMATVAVGAANLVRTSSGLASPETNRRSQLLSQQSSALLNVTMTRLSAAEPELGDEEKDQLKLQKVIKLQRAFRLLNHVYAHFGGLLFVDAKGDSAHGRITYETSPRGSAWISIAPTTSIPKLYRFMDRFWNMSRPEVIISIPHGLPGSEDVHMPSQLQLAFDRGLVSAAKSAKAWVITSGADCGVAKLVGDVFHRYDVGLPLLGVLPWGFTNGREQLSRSNGSVCTYKPRAYDTEEGAPLNQHHTHFILVDDGQRGGAAWGRDVDEHGRAASSACEQLRIDLEQAVATKKNIPLVQLVVHGGPKTLQAVHRNALGGKPIVVLAESGGAARAIFEFCTHGLEAVEEEFKATPQLVQQLEAIKQLNGAYAGKQLTFFRLEGAPAGQMPDLSSSLLEARSTTSCTSTSTTSATTISATTTCTCTTGTCTTGTTTCMEPGRRQDDARALRV